MPLLPRTWVPFLHPLGSSPQLIRVPYLLASERICTHMVHINPCRHIYVNKKVILNLKREKFVCVYGGRDTSIFFGFIYYIKIRSAETMHVLLCLIVLKNDKNGRRL